MDETCPKEREQTVIQAPLPGDWGGHNFLTNGQQRHILILLTIHGFDHHVSLKFRGCGYVSVYAGQTAVPREEPGSRSRNFIGKGGHRFSEKVGTFSSRLFKGGCIDTVYVAGCLWCC